jgi:hypothetical protein
MTAARVLKEAAACGVKLLLSGGKLKLKAETRPPDALLAKLKEHKAGIVALLQEVDEAASAATSRPSWWPEPHPRIVREPPFGSGGVPARYRAAWDGLLAQCPAGMAPSVWETAMYDAARLFGDFGVELERRRLTFPSSAGELGRPCPRLVPAPLRRPKPRKPSAPGPRRQPSARPPAHEALRTSRQRFGLAAAQRVSEVLVSCLPHAISVLAPNSDGAVKIVVPG